MSFEIEKNIPAPKKQNGRPAKYPFREMEIGDSFVFDYGIRLKVNWAASTFGKRHGRNYVVRKISDTEGRCWRIE